MSRNDLGQMDVSMEAVRARAFFTGFLKRAKVDQRMQLVYGDRNRKSTRQAEL